MKNKILLIAAGFACTICFFSCLKEESLDEIYRPAGTEIVFSAANSYESDEERTRVDFTGPDSLFFETAASGEAVAETRTIFTGSGSNTIERIDWVNGDRMSISYQRKSKTTQTGIYQVTSGVAGENGTVDNAGVDYISGTKLTWENGSGTHYFYAVYPAHGQSDCSFAPTFSSGSSISNRGATISGKIPSAQSVKYSTYNSQTKYLPEDMTRCYMVGYLAFSSSSPTARVTIPFAPAVTMFEFNLKSSTTMKVRKATLSAAHIDGPFSLTLKGENGTDSRLHWMTNIQANAGTGKIEVTFKKANGSTEYPEISSSKNLNFTVLANPISYTDPVLELELEHSGNVYTKKIQLKGGTTSGSHHTFAAFKKHIITYTNVPTESWEYTFTHVGTTMTAGGYTYQEIVRTTSDAGSTGSASFNSTKKDAGSGEGAIAMSDFTYEYAPDNNGVPGTFSTTKPTGVDDPSVVVNSSPMAFKGNWAANSGTSITTLTQLRGANMQSKGSYGTSDAPQDLSLCTVASSGITTRSSGPTTANCYIIDRPGWYMFPLVYGNAIVGGNENSAAYTTSASVSNGWSTLHNYNGSNISSPYIPTDVNVTTISSSALNATIVWQDASGSTATATWDPTFISQVSVIAKPSGAKVNTSYIKFYVDPATVHPGNAVIALRNGNTIIWSWHIWLTDGVDTNNDGKGDGFPTFIVKKHPSSTNAMSQNSFLQIPLGACETGTVSGVTVSSERAAWVRVTQSGTSNHLYFRIVQRGATSGTATITGKDISPTFYQWGRKDPFLPRKGGTTSSNKDCTGTSLTLGTDPDNTAAKSIMNPTVFYYVGNGYATNWLGVVVVNLWNMNQTSANQDRTVTKTVYDPCPPGFSLPNRNAFQNFATDGGNSNSNINAYGSWSNGYTFYTQAQGSGASFYFRAFGCRQSTTGAIGDVNSVLAYWTSSGTTNFCSNALSADPSQGVNVPRCYPFGSDRSSFGYPVYPAVQ